MRPIQNDIETIVGYVKESLGLDNLKFYCSTPNEFIAMLNSLKSNDHMKYPFFFINSTDIRYNDYDKLCYVGDIVIATLSKPDFTSKAREEKSMTPILKPIFNEFLRYTKINKWVKLHKEGDMYVHYFYGKTGIVGYESGIFPDHVDAIQLKNYQFRVKKECKTN